MDAVWSVINLFKIYYTNSMHQNILHLWLRCLNFISFQAKWSRSTAGMHLFKMGLPFFFLTYLEVIKEEPVLAVTEIC